MKKIIFIDKNIASEAAPSNLIRFFLLIYKTL